MSSQISSREFLKEIAALGNKLRFDIESFSTGLDNSPDAIKQRRKRVLDGDFKFFAYTYFPHHIRGTSSLFQSHFCTRLPQILERKSGAIEWWIAPRGEAKSSLASKITPVWCVVQALRQNKDIQKELDVKPPAIFCDYVILLGAETSLPDKLVEVVKTELTVNPALMLDFPEVCGRGSQWKIGEIVTKTGVKVEAFGAEQGIRGTSHGASRPTLIIGDDLIKDSEAKSPTERNNRWEFITKAIEYLGPPDGSVKYIGVGTVLNKDDPISRAKKTVGHVVHHFKALVQEPINSDLWAKCEELMLNDDKHILDEYTRAGQDVPEESLPSYIFYMQNKEAMDLGAVISWASVRSLYWLMRQKAKDKSAFATEMQGDARADEDKVFTNITYWQQRSHDWIIFGACDPSMGRGETSDPSAILIGGYDTKLKKLHVMEADIKRRVPSKLEADLISAQRFFNTVAMGFENNNAYEHSRTTFIKAGIAAGVPLPLVGITAKIPLEVRVDSLEPYITDKFSPSIVFNPKLKLLIDELDTWPLSQTHHHYDGLSALHLLWTVAITRSGGYDGYQSLAPRNRYVTADNNCDFDGDDNIYQGREIW